MKKYFLFSLAIMALNTFTMDQSIPKKRQSTVSCGELQEAEGRKIKLPKSEVYGLFEAVSEGRLDIVKTLLNANNIESRNSDGNTPLLLACSSGKLEIVQCLLNLGASIEAENNNKDTSLLIASRCGHLNVIRCLIKCGADINAINHCEFNSLHEACRNAHLHVIKYLLLNYPDLAKNNNDDLNLYPFWYLRNYTNILHKVLHFIERKGLKERLNLNSSDLSIFLAEPHAIGEALSQLGLDSIYGEFIHERFYRLIRVIGPLKEAVLDGARENIDLSGFYIVKNVILDHIEKNDWSFVKRKQYVILLQLIKEKLLSEKESSSEEELSDAYKYFCKKRKLLLSLLFTPYEMFKIIQSKYQEQMDGQEVNLEELIKIVSKEYNLAELTDKDDNNLLHLTTNNDLYKLIVSINPNLICMRNNKGDVPFDCQSMYYDFLHHQNTLNN